MEKKRRVLITGAGSGFGRLTAVTLAGRGHAVAATMRDPAGRNAHPAAELERAGARVFELDVTSDASVQKGVSAAETAFGGLDAVVNNAGIGVLGLQEAFPAGDWKRLFEINVFGVQRVNRAALPAMRAAGSGLLVHVASILGRITLPFYGPYNASKWALEALAETYRVELSGLGVDVCVVEPGGFPTSFMDRLMKPCDPKRAAGYGPLAQACAESLDGYAESLAAHPAQNPQLVADAVVSLVEAEPGRRPFRTVVDRMGMCEPIVDLNARLERAMIEIYGACGIGGMLKPVAPAGAPADDRPAETATGR